MKVARLLKQPSGFLPVVISLFCLGMVLWHVARVGPGPEADEGTEAHLFQLLMAIQAGIILWFAAKWLPQEPKAAGVVLAMQLAAVAAAFGAVYYFNL